MSKYAYHSNDSFILIVYLVDDEARNQDLSKGGFNFDMVGR